MDMETALSNKRRTADERREDVLRAAVQEFGSFGYSGGSTERIAAAAEISQPYVLRLFGSKLKLFVATLAHVCETIEATWAQALEKQPATGWDALMVIGASYASGTDIEQRFRVIMQGVAAAGTPEIEAEINASMDRLWSWVEQNTGADYSEIQRFWAFGMMQTMGVSMNAPRYMADSPRARAMILPPES